MSSNYEALLQQVQGILVVVLGAELNCFGLYTFALQATLTIRSLTKEKARLEAEQVLTEQILLYFTVLCCRTGC